MTALHHTMGRISRRTILALIGAICIAAVAKPSEQQSDLLNGHWDEKDIITRDVCIIGGGSTGTYAGVRLQFDLNQTVQIVERKNRLGGHTETYKDPKTGIKVDIGVVFFQNMPIVYNYFGRFGIPLINISYQAAETSPVTDYVDFRTGKVVSGFIPSDPTAALEAYAAQLAKFPFLQVPGLGNLPDPVPAELLLSFDDFVEQYNLSAAAELIFGFGQGSGLPSDVPTLYVMKVVSLSVVAGMSTGFLTTARHDNSELYEKAEAQLSAADALLLESTVIVADRNADKDGCVKLVVSTPEGPKLIKAKRILVTIPTTLPNMEPFGVDANESSIFEQFSATGYYTGLINNTGIPDNNFVLNTGADTLFNLAQVPGSYLIKPTAIPGVHNVVYGSPTVLSNDYVANDIVAEVNRLKTSGTLDTTTPGFVVFSGHSPFLLTVPADAIANGFYTKLFGLQGYRNTYYTGANFHTHDSTTLWEFNEGLLPSIIAGR